MQKAKVKLEQQKNTTGLWFCNNNLAMTQPLHSKAPTFIGDNKVKLSWILHQPWLLLRPGLNELASSASKGSDNNAKRPRGGGYIQNQLVNRAFGYLGSTAKQAASSGNKGSDNIAKRARGGGPIQNQLVNRAFEGLSRGGGRSNGRDTGLGSRGSGRAYR